MFSHKGTKVTKDIKFRLCVRVFQLGIVLFPSPVGVTGISVG